MYQASRKYQLSCTSCAPAGNKPSGGCWLYSSWVSRIKRFTSDMRPSSGNTSVTDDNLPTRLHDPHHLRERPLFVAKLGEATVVQYGIERTIGEGQVCRLTLDEVGRDDIANLPLTDAQHPARYIESDDTHGRAALRYQRQVRAGADGNF